jgi:hypothetical protein
MSKKIVILIRQEGLGQVAPHDRRFGYTMLDKFLHTLEKQAIRPQVICLYTEGVKIACEGSPVIPGLKLLEGLGIPIVVCGTCLEYFGIKDKIAVGSVGGMDGILKLLVEADQVITA